MKYIRHGDVACWNGSRPLPAEIHVLSYQDAAAEFELLSILCALHGHLTAFDILRGAEEGTEKDADLTVVLTAFQRYIAPKMPLSNYSATDQRKKSVALVRRPLDSSP
jgi:hypothetical protein